MNGKLVYFFWTVTLDDFLSDLNAQKFVLIGTIRQTSLEVKSFDKKLASNAISSSSSGISSGGYKLTSSREPKYSSRLVQHSSRQSR